MTQLCVICGPARRSGNRRLGLTTSAAVVFLTVGLSKSVSFVANLGPGCAWGGARGRDFRSVPLFWAGRVEHFSKLAA